MSEVAVNKEVPEGWVSVPLEDCAEILDSRRIPLNSKERSVRIEGKSQDQLYPYYGATGQVGFIDDFIFEGEHLLIGEDGAPFFDKSKNVAYIANAKFWVNNHAHILNALKGVTTNKYLLHYLNNFNYKDFVGGTTRLKLNQRDLKKIPVPLAPPEQQKRIVAKIEELFSHIDAGIEALKKAKQLLKQYRQSVLKVAVTGELTKEWREARIKDDAHGSANVAGGRKPGATKLEPASQLLERILKERRQKWEEQQLEQFKVKGKIPKDDKWKEKYKEAIEFESSIDIPKEWIGVTSDQVFYYVTSGSRGWAKYYSEEGSIFLRMGNLEHYDVRIDLKDIQRVSPPEGAEGSRTKVKPGDSLISITADVGMVGIVPDDFEEAYINQHVSLARPVIRLMGLYLAWLLSGDFAKEQFKALQRGATKVGLGLDDIRAIQFGLPSLEEQEEIVRLIEEKLSSIEHLDTELDQQLVKAEKNKQSILASAFSGRIN